MTEVPRLTGTQLILRFLERYEQDSVDPTTALGIHYEKFRRDHRAGTDFEWTAVMTVFLSGVARSFRLAQEWESVESTRLAWYDGSRPDPQVVLAHSNWWGDVGPKPVERLLGVRAPLKAYITYGYDRSATDPGGPVRAIEGTISANQASIGTTEEFVLLIANETVADWKAWRTFRWDPASQRLDRTPE